MKNKNINNIVLATVMSSILAACSSDGTNDSGNDDNGFNDIPDVTAPIITLNGSNNVSILINENYIDSGALADDAVDGPLQVTKMGSVDTTTAGSYIIAYNATDAAGNAADEVTRTVTVIDGTPFDLSQKLYGLKYDLYDGFDFKEVSINQSYISYLDGEVINSAVMFTQGDSYYSASAGQWVGRNPANFAFELVDLNTVGIVNGVNKLTIENVDDISGQLLIVDGNELASNLPEGATRYSVKTETLEDLYTIDRKITFNGVVAQTLDEVLTNGCGDTNLIDAIENVQLNNASIPCSESSLTEGTITATNTNGDAVNNVGIWSIGKISDSEIDVLKVTMNPSYLDADSEQLTEHQIFAIKDGEVWTGKMTAQGAVKVDTYYNDVAVQNRILDSCFTEDADGDYIDC